jgi:trk system potassium uptake protein
MNIIICGAGEVGQSIARQLARESHDVTIIDKNPDLIRHMNESEDVKAIVGMASHPSVLVRAGIEQADMIIAVTYSDEVNMIACQVAHSLFNTPSRIARVRQQDYLQPQWRNLFSDTNLPIEVTISPEKAVSDAIIRRLHTPGAMDSVPFGKSSEVQLLAIRCEADCPLVNVPNSMFIAKLKKHNVGFLGAVHKGKFVMPDAKVVLHEDDIAYLIVEQSNTAKVMTLFGHHEQEARSVIILGGGNIGLSTAQVLEEQDQHVKVRLVELNKERAEYAANRLKRATVINGSGLEKNILFECGVEKAEIIVAVTNDDKVNILASLLAKRLGCKRSITLVNNANYATMLGNLEIDVLVNPRETTVSNVLRLTRRGKILALHSIMEGSAEVIEAEVQSNSFIVGKVVGNLNLPKSIRLAALLREHQLIFPEAHDIIHEGDEVFMVCLADSIKLVEQYFATQDVFF